MSNGSTLPETDVPRLSRWLQWRIFVRSLALQGSWNGQRMQNLGLLVTFFPWLRRQHWDINRDRLFCRRYFEYFNTNPYLANLLIGGLIRLETEHAARGEDPTLMARRFRDSLCRAFASLGDQLFWLGLRPALTMALCLLGMYGLIKPIFLIVAVFAALQLFLRFWALGRSYELGLDIVDLINHPHWHRAISWTKRAAMVLTGAVAGRYLSSVGNWDFMAGKGLLWVGMALGIGLPLILRRRLPGEALLGLALGLALLLSFAI
nr:PTS system mannose/fructose/sorbose family transporter subunit IID [Candidatus Krumholzibacteria bacterium]